MHEHMCMHSIQLLLLRLQNNEFGSLSGVDKIYTLNQVQFIIYESIAWMSYEISFVYLCYYFYDKIKSKIYHVIYSCFNRFEIFIQFWILSRNNNWNGIQFS